MILLMAIDSILAQIDEEIAKLKQVRALLATTGKVATKLAERKTKEALVKPAKVAKAAKTAKTKKRRVLSPEARKRIADAQRKRWAAQKSKA
jgi:hypothetical protein